MFSSAAQLLAVDTAAATGLLSVYDINESNIISAQSLTQYRLLDINCVYRL